MSGSVQELKAFLREYREEIKRSAYELLEQELPELTEELFALFEQNGNRLKYEAVYFTRRKFLAVLGMEAILEKEAGKADTELLGKLCCVLEEICGEECWALPAHVNRREDPEWRITVDLFASETAQTLSELSDRLGEALPEKLREKIVQEVERRVLIPYFTSQVPYRNWEHSDNNWNAVCAGSIGSACLHMLREDPKRLNACLDRICRALTFYVKGFAQDGTCTEGLGYYNYGMTYFANFAQELFEYTGGKQDLFCGKWGDLEACGQGEDKRTRMAHFPAKCFFPDGLTVSFSDGNIHEIWRAGVLCVLAMHYPGIRFPDIRSAATPHTDSCYRFAAVKMDLLETERYLKQPEREEHQGGGRTGRADSAFYILPSAQWCIGYAANTAGFACKGGNNGESHNHNDIGHFLYEAGGVMLLTDLGSGEYTKDYFSDKRYEILCNNSFGHSVPILDGRGQCAGAQYHCGRFEAGADGSVSMELGGAYELPGTDALEKERAGIVRELQFDRDTGRLALNDSFYRAGCEITENLVTQIRPEVEGNRVILKKDGVRAVIEIQDEQVASGQESIVICRQEHRNHAGDAETVYQIRWKVAVSGGCGRSRAVITAEL